MTDEEKYPFKRMFKILHSVQYDTEEEYLLIFK